MSKRYKQIIDGVPMEVRLVRGRFLIKHHCCDCALVHKKIYQLVSRTKMVITTWRDKRATAAC